jgi:hypothetical protein
MLKFRSAASGIAVVLGAALIVGAFDRCSPLSDAALRNVVGGDIKMNAVCTDQDLTCFSCGWVGRDPINPYEACTGEDGLGWCDIEQTGICWRGSKNCTGCKQCSTQNPDGTCSDCTYKGGLPYEKCL